jgi:hypothetical protein
VKNLAPGLFFFVMAAGLRLPRQRGERKCRLAPDSPLTQRPTDHREDQVITPPRRRWWQYIMVAATSLLLACAAVVLAVGYTGV